MQLAPLPVLVGPCIHPISHETSPKSTRALPLRSGRFGQGFEQAWAQSVGASHPGIREFRTAQLKSQFSVQHRGSHAQIAVSQAISAQPGVPCGKQHSLSPQRDAHKLRASHPGINWFSTAQPSSHSFRQQNGSQAQTSSRQEASLHPGVPFAVQQLPTGGCPQVIVSCPTPQVSAALPTRIFSVWSRVTAKLTSERFAGLPHRSSSHANGAPRGGQLEPV